MIRLVVLRLALLSLLLGLLPPALPSTALATASQSAAAPIVAAPAAAPTSAAVAAMPLASRPAPSPNVTPGSTPAHAPIGQLPSTSGSIEILLPTRQLNPGGVYRYTNGVWTLKSNGLPSGQGDWQGVVADPLNRSRWILWNNLAAFITSDSGDHWAAIDDVFRGAGSQPSIHPAITNAAFSETEAGTWSVVAKHWNSFTGNTVAIIARGSGTTITSWTDWLGDAGAGQTDGPQNYPTAITTGLTGQMVTATNNAGEAVGTATHVYGYW